MTIVQAREEAEIEQLRDRCRGAVIAPGEEAWDAARQAFNLSLDQRPAVIAFPLDEQDVASVIRFARERGLPVAPQRTGHGAPPPGALGGAVLLKTDAMEGVEIDPAACRARIRAGAKWEDVVPAASELGLAALHGSSPDIGIVGFSLGGGIGWYARKHGLAANSVTAIDLVTADGRVRRVDHDHEPELFWALRGGGGNFGVVTALEFELHPVAGVYAGVLFFPWERSSEVLHAWHEWLPGLPDEVTSVGRIFQFPPLPDIPDPLRGNSFVLVEAAYLGAEDDGAELLRPLRALGPTIDTFAIVPPAALSDLHMDPRDPVPYSCDHQLLDDLPPKAVDALVDAAGPESGSPLVSVELRHAGGALARSASHHGALSTLVGSFAMFAIGVPLDAASAAAIEAQLTRIAAALEPYDIGRYWNFTENDRGAAQFFPEETYHRLEAVKAMYDPENVFRANHVIGSAC